MDKIQALRECPLFRALDEPVRAKLAALCQEQTFAKGDILFREGEASRDLLVVMQGVLDIRKGWRSLQSSRSVSAIVGRRPRDNSSRSRTGIADPFWSPAASRSGQLSERARNSAFS